jgi:hypothetical protein
MEWGLRHRVILEDRVIFTVGSNQAWKELDLNQGFSVSF